MNRTIETQEIEYKDFSKNQNLEKKKVISKLYKEITAFANSKGGKIIVGKDDKSEELNPQPQEIKEWLDNDYLTSEINRIADNLVVFECKEDDGIITITVQESEDLISAAIDYKGIHKGDCFTRQNHETIIARGMELRRLIERKNISVDNKLKGLRKIVHYKFAKGENHASKMNIFDSLVVKVESKDKFISTVFDNFIMNQFIGGYDLPLSKHSTMQLHLETMAFILTASEPEKSSIALKREAFNKLKKNPDSIKAFFLSHRERILSCPQLKNYLLEYKHIIAE